MCTKIKISTRIHVYILYLTLQIYINYLKNGSKQYPLYIIMYLHVYSIYKVETLYNALISFTHILFHTCIHLANFYTLFIQKVLN